MPVYNYKCPACAQEIEVIRKISERDNEMICPVLCCSNQMERTVAAPKSVHGGFYDNLKSGGSNL
ncbi:FmdB-like transcriptional regulator [Citrobacter phage Merlin]|uniref:FmdB family regulatory protein n=1 Tax=Citrobacter phage Merlin TaxID=1675602 RepID=A0A0K1LMA2_9CAUD|nr:FmdB-like transcriptional regulator [Citrobacter phage Merlin]AKU43657.1 FmdB family regulatory protein [Citrobacter phage Merlin]